MKEKNLGSNHKNKEMGFWNGGGYPMMEFETFNENTRYNQPSQVGVSKKLKNQENRKKNSRKNQIVKKTD
jgi:hypothetical protein